MTFTLEQIFYKLTKVEVDDDGMWFIYLETSMNPSSNQQFTIMINPENYPDININRQDKITVGFELYCREINVLKEDINIVKGGLYE